MRHFTAGGHARILDTLESGATNSSRINFRIRGDVTNDPFEVALRDDTTGTALKQYDFNGVATDEDWYHFVATWFGSDLKGYRNGVEDTSPNKISDDTIALVERDRELWIGENASAAGQRWEGVLGYVAMWNSVLSDDEIKELSLHGLEFDLRQPGQVYNSEGDLSMFFYFGLNPDSALGADLGSGNTDLTPTSLDEADSFGDNPRIR